MTKLSEGQKKGLRRKFAKISEELGLFGLIIQRSNLDGGTPKSRWGDAKSRWGDANSRFKYCLYL